MLVGASSGYSLRQSACKKKRSHKFWGQRLLAVGMLVAAVNIGIGIYQPFDHAGAAQDKQSASDTMVLVASKSQVTPTLDPATEPTPQPRPDASLAQNVTNAVNSTASTMGASRWGAAVYDLDTNQWLAQINGDTAMESASLYKLFAAYSLAKTKSVDSWDTVSVAGHTLRECVDLMLRVSDNECGEAVAKYVGWRKNDQIIHAYGFMHTKLNMTPGPVTTANDTAQFMIDLYQNKLLDAASTEAIVTPLKNQRFRSAIPAGCSGCVVANKTGNSAAVAHDVAIVDNGVHHYVVSIMTEGGSYQKIANIERAIEAVLRAN